MIISLAIDHAPDLVFAFSDDDGFSDAKFIDAFADDFDGLADERFLVDRLRHFIRINADEERCAAAQIQTELEFASRFALKPAEDGARKSCDERAVPLVSHGPGAAATKVKMPAPSTAAPRPANAVPPESSMSRARKPRSTIVRWA